jgi:hypothetical protein
LKGLKCTQILSQQAQWVINYLILGLLLNSAYVLLRVFFGKNLNDINFFDIINKIDITFAMSSNKLNFSKFERINNEKVKDLITQHEPKSNSTEYNFHTKIFFLIHSILAFCIGKLDEEYHKVGNQFGDMVRANAHGDPKL